MQHTINIPAQYNGPNGFGNGGYVCGLMAEHFPWIAEFRLRKMIPVDQALTLDVQAKAATLYTGKDTFVTAQPSSLSNQEIPSNPGFEQAAKAGEKYLGHHNDLEYSNCYVCSSNRPNDGMCVHTGPTAKNGVYAACWVPQPYMLNEQGYINPTFIYAALDCPGAYSAMGQQVETMLLGSFTVEISGQIKAGDKCVVVAWCSGKEDRRRYAHTALYGPNNEVIGRADAIWWQV